QESIAAAELLSDPYYLASSTNRRYRIDIDSLDELADTPIVARRRCKSWTGIEALLRAQGINPKYAIRTDDVLALKEFVQSGVGVASVSHLSLERLGDDALETRSVEDLVPPRRIALIWSRDRGLGSHEQAFLSLTLEVCRALVSPSRHR